MVINVDLNPKEGEKAPENSRAVNSINDITPCSH